jgi:hypothetical protein
MSTLADELLQDFEDSGSENGDAQIDAALDLGDDPALANGHYDAHGGMILDGDEDEELDADEDMGGIDVVVDAMEDAEAAKARVERMQLGKVKDVRQVTAVMHRLEPLLKVSPSSSPTPFPPFPILNTRHGCLQWVAGASDLTDSLACRRTYPISNRGLCRTRPSTSAISKTTPNTKSLPSPTHSPPR